MTNLVSTYGVDWFNSKFSGSFFRYKGLPARVVRARTVGKKGAYENEVQIAVLNKTKGEIKAHSRTVSTDLFPDGSPFVVPELGYRSVHEGRWLAFLQRNNSSYIRGLASKNLRVVEHPITQYLRSEGMYSSYMGPDDLQYMAMNKDFIPFYKGIKLMLEGKIFSFAASPAIAVVPASRSSTRLDILFCDKLIGSVDDNGAVSITSKIARNYVEENVCHQSLNS